MKKILLSVIFILSFVFLFAKMYVVAFALTYLGIFFIIHKNLKFCDELSYLTSNKFLSYSDEYFTENWDSIESQRKALAEYYEILENNKNEFIIKTESGNVYKTTLDGCTCQDYQKRKEPCKHMYFVAHKLNFFNLLWGFKNSLENKKLVEIFSKNIFKGDSFIAIPDKDLENLSHFEIVNLRKITPKLMNLEKEMIIKEFPNIIEELNNKGANIDEKVGKKKFLNFISDLLPDFAHTLIEKYVIVNVDFNNPKLKSYSIRQAEFKKNKYSKNYLEEDN